MFENYLEFQEAAVEIEKVQKDTLQSVFAEDFGVFARHVDRVS